MKNARRILFATAVLGISWLGTFLILSMGISAPGTKVNLLKKGDIAQSLRQAAQLLSALQANGWDRWKVDQALLRLPDQDLAETDFERRPETLSFSVSSLAPYQARVAFYCNTYVRNNIRAGDGVEGVVSSPEGFFIVGWKDGRIEQVPIESVRLLPFDLNGRPVKLFVFPGMADYDASLEKYPGVS